MADYNYRAIVRTITGFQAFLFQTDSLKRVPSISKKSKEETRIMILKMALQNYVDWAESNPESLWSSLKPNLGIYIDKVAMKLSKIPHPKATTYLLDLERSDSLKKIAVDLICLSKLPTNVEMSAWTDFAHILGERVQDKEHRSFDSLQSISSRSVSSIASSEKADELRSWAQIELKETEYHHLCQLNALKEKFFDPLGDGKIISQEERKYAVPDVTDLIKLHEKMHQAIEEGIKDDTLGNKILPLIPKMFAYKNFVASSSSNRQNIRNLCEKNTKFSEFIEESAKDPRCNKMKLMDMVTSFAQRPTRYRLLIDAILKYTPIDNPDFENLEKAIEEFSKVTTKLDNHQDEENGRLQIFKIKDDVEGCPDDFLKPRKFIQSFNADSLDAFSGKLHKRITLHMFNDAILISQSRKNKPDKFVQLIPIDKAKVYSLVNQGFENSLCIECVIKHEKKLIQLGEHLPRKEASSLSLNRLSKKKAKETDDGSGYIWDISFTLESETSMRNFVFSLLEAKKLDINKSEDPVPYQIYRSWNGDNDVLLYKVFHSLEDYNGYSGKSNICFLYADSMYKKSDVFIHDSGDDIDFVGIAVDNQKEGFEFKFLASEDLKGISGETKSDSIIELLRRDSKEFIHKKIVDMNYVYREKCVHLPDEQKQFQLRLKELAHTLAKMSYNSHATIKIKAPKTLASMGNQINGVSLASTLKRNSSVSSNYSQLFFGGNQSETASINSDQAMDENDQQSSLSYSDQVSMSSGSPIRKYSKRPSIANLFSNINNTLNPSNSLEKLLNSINIISEYMDSYGVGRDHLYSQKCDQDKVVSLVEKMHHGINVETLLKQDIYVTAQAFKTFVKDNSSIIMPKIICQNLLANVEEEDIAEKAHKTICSSGMLVCQQYECLSRIIDHLHKVNLYGNEEADSIDLATEWTECIFGIQEDDQVKQTCGKILQKLIVNYQEIFTGLERQDDFDRQSAESSDTVWTSSISRSSTTRASKKSNFAGNTRGSLGAIAEKMKSTFKKSSESSITRSLSRLEIRYRAPKLERPNSRSTIQDHRIPRVPVPYQSTPLRQSSDSSMESLPEEDFTEENSIQSTKPKPRRPLSAKNNPKFPNFEPNSLEEIQQRRFFSLQSSNHSLESTMNAVFEINKIEMELNQAKFIKEIESIKSQLEKLKVENNQLTESEQSEDIEFKSSDFKRFDIFEDIVSNLSTLCESQISESTEKYRSIVEEFEKFVTAFKDTETENSRLKKEIAYLKKERAEWENREQKYLLEAKNIEKTSAV